MISSPHLATILLHYMLQRWSQHLNRCVAASASKVMKATGVRVPFSLKPILVELEVSCYIGPILPIFLANLVTGRRSAVGSAPRSDDNGGNKRPTPKVGATGGPARVWARYEAHLPSLSLRDGENLRYILAGGVLPTMNSHTLYKNWHLWGGGCWEECDPKNLHVPTPTEMANIITGIPKVARGGC